MRIYRNDDIKASDKLYAESSNQRPHCLKNKVTLRGMNFLGIESLPHNKSNRRIGKLLWGQERNTSISKRSDHDINQHQNKRRKRSLMNSVAPVVITGSMRFVF